MTNKEAKEEARFQRESKAWTQVACDGYLRAHKKAVESAIAEITDNLASQSEAPRYVFADGEQFIQRFELTPEEAEQHGLKSGTFYRGDFTGDKAVFTEVEK